MAFCMGCGDELAPGDRFCASCGRPAEGPATSGATVSTSSAASVEVPTWLSQGWGQSTTRAVGAGLIGIVAQYAVGIILLFGLIATLGGDASAIDWGQTLKTPFFVWLGMHGAVEGNAMWLTAIAWIVSALYLTRRFGWGTPPAESDSQHPLLALAIGSAKTAVLYALFIVIFLIVLDPIGVSSGSIVGPSGFAGGWNPAGAFFSTLLVVLIGTLGIDAYAQRPKELGTGAIGLVRAGIRGSMTILLTSIVGLLAFVLVGAMLDMIGTGDEFLGWLGSVLMWLMVAILAWAGIDVGLALMASAMGFFPDDTGYSAVESILGDPAWLIAGSAVVAVAFAWGGYRAARSSGSTELSRLLQASGLAGIGVTVTFVLASFVVGSRIEEIKGGIGLSLLWTIVALGGGLLFAQSIGALQSVMPTTSATGEAEPDKACGDCGAANPSDAAFCANCGSATR